MEKRYKITVSDQSVVLELSVGKKNKLARRSLLIASSVIFLIPIIVILLFFLPSGEPPQFGFIFSLIISWLCGGYLLKLYLWNTHGREFLLFGARKLTYYADYKLMKDRYKETSYNRLDIYYVDNNELFPISDLKNKSTEYVTENQSPLCILINGKETVESHIELPLADIIDIYNQSESVLKSKCWIT